MKEFDYVRTMREFYVPRTPRAALVAVEAEILPIEAFVFKTASIKPLFEEPYDPDELERFLAQPDLDFSGAMLLSEIFVAMTMDEDKERALFAAESLTTLEERWARKVIELRSRPDGRDGEGSLLLGRTLFERALVEGRNPSIRDHYLREALKILDESPEAEPGKPGFGLRIRCMVKLGLMEAAEALILPFLEGIDDGEVLALAVEIAYIRKDVHRIDELLRGRDLEKLGIDGEVRSILEFWRG